jgi:Collagen triple helix repeat (20 copies)
MFKRIHQKLGTAGFLIAIVALVAALGGTAFAAAKLNGTQKKEVEKIAKKYAGKPGANGAAGPAGAVGPAGPKGDAGSAGSNGTNGTNGKDGTSVTNTALAKGSATCSEGGAEFKVGTGAATHACNGVTGFTETLPSGETETGTWAVNQPFTNEFFENHVPISFPIPLKEAGGPTDVFFFSQEQVENKEFGSSGCHWELEEIEAQPEATVPGTLCFFTQGGEISEASPHIYAPGEAAARGYGPSGAFLTFASSSGEASEARLYGAWAVTAP